jgi:23S rRNA pseudouridine2605 synthase
MKKQTGFEKFQKVKKGSVLKEQIRQEKKKVTRERKEYFETKRREQAEARNPEIKAAAPVAPKYTAVKKSVSEEMPLNKYIAHSGVCSRRDAAELIKTGK